MGNFRALNEAVIKGDVCSNVIEPHLGYSLRRMEIDLQPGPGMGHSLAGIFEIGK